MSQDIALPVFGMLFVIVIVSLRVWSRTRKTRLKDKMVERGFTPAEIKEVMDAGESVMPVQPTRDHRPPEPVHVA